MGLQVRNNQARLYRAGFIAVLLAAVCAQMTTFLPAADAFVKYGCKFAGTSPPIGYKFMNASLTFNPRLQEAADNWNSKDVPGTFILVTSSDPEVEVSSGTFASESSWAWVTPSPCVGGSWQGNEVTLTFNYATVSGLTEQNLRRIAVHELGHTYGLDHDSMTCSGDKKVMEQGTNKFNCSGTPPWDDDQDGVRAIY